jgi:formate C-acetyltransferase
VGERRCGLRTSTSRRHSRDLIHPDGDVMPHFLVHGESAVEVTRLSQQWQDPGQYHDLVVRVAGFSEFFVNLTPEMQEEIIARTAHM